MYPMPGPMLVITRGPLVVPMTGGPVVPMTRPTVVSMPGLTMPGLTMPGPTVVWGRKVPIPGLTVVLMTGSPIAFPTGSEKFNGLGRLNTIPSLPWPGNAGNCHHNLVAGSFGLVFLSSSSSFLSSSRLPGLGSCFRPTQSSQIPSFSLLIGLDSSLPLGPRQLLPRLWHHSSRNRHWCP